MGKVNGVMKMYQIIEEEFDSSETGCYTAYGIAYNVNGESLSVSDLTLDKERAQAFVLLCNRLSLDPEQLLDAAEDFVFEEGLVKG